MLSVDVHAANIHDTKSGIYTTKEAYMSYPTIQKFCADAGYRGTFVSNVNEKLGLDVDISEKIKPHQWEKLPWRWVVGIQNPRLCRKLLFSNTSFEIILGFI